MRSAAPSFRDAAPARATPGAILRMLAVNPDDVDVERFERVPAISSHPAVLAALVPTEAIGTFRKLVLRLGGRLPGERVAVGPQVFASDQP